MQQQPHAIIVGSGIGGLATSIRLQVKGYQVSVYEANSYPGGKLNILEDQGFRFDTGPSLFTMPQLVMELFELAGEKPEDWFDYHTLEVLTKYFYPDGTSIEAFAQPRAFSEEVERQTGEPSERIAAFLEHSRKLYDITHHVFLERSLHKLSTYTRMGTVISTLRLPQLDPFRSMDQANRSQFEDPRVVQLFNRYATYNGSNPYEAPATLNIIPHLEFNMGAYLPKRGMYQITESIVKLAKKLGVKFHLNTPVEQILVERKKAVGVQVNGASISADLVVSNADVVPTYRKLLPDQPHPERTLTQPRSSSALIFYWGIGAEFPELDLHNIFFSESYEAEFACMWEEKSIYHDPTIYVNITSKLVPEDAPEGCENWFVMVNAPANTGQDWDTLIAQTRQHILDKLKRQLGKDIEPLIRTESILEPRTIESKTSSYQGALYGTSSNNLFAAFLRHPNFSRKIENLYFCGGSVHPGGGIPLSLLGAKIVGEMVPTATSYRLHP
ncbi:1-hydroxycarotenoid 3,4-desaturase CrtD [Pontibacter sp. G13]|uniref:1-hydroxycarotenoid 3,4-desaturase CrtD n=1 Tax=Pontibacter sp. G13 TaxID=3074898 RepID=UPI00288A6334|nr:1-hydroxycarotenoid 3,4-desaturase CrtD [Pontibacter sp. G13]WNJ18477.1 1-hydroxycarotenoid 3,4-desaturase CrtD [Pontibacter sp. G13]